MSSKGSTSTHVEEGDGATQSYDPACTCCSGSHTSSSPLSGVCRAYTSMNTYIADAIGRICASMHSSAIVQPSTLCARPAIHILAPGVNSSASYAQNTAAGDATRSAAKSAKNDDSTIHLPTRCTLGAASVHAQLAYEDSRTEIMFANMARYVSTRKATARPIGRSGCTRCAW
jgi:hypothetical protein